MKSGRARNRIRFFIARGVEPKQRKGRPSGREESCPMLENLGVVNLWTYALGALVLVLMPGPNSLFVLRTSVQGGTARAMKATCAVFLGDAILIACAFLGIASILQAHPALFTAVRFAGAGYLAWLGLGSRGPSRGAAARRRRAPPPPPRDSRPSGPRSFFPSRTRRRSSFTSRFSSSSSTRPIRGPGCPTSCSPRSSRPSVCST